MSSLRKALVFFLLSVLFAAKLERSYGHSLLQLSSSSSEFTCTLTPEQIQPYRRGLGGWIITDLGLEALNGDIQSLVNCTEDGDVLLFDVETPVQPRSRVTIPWNLTLSAFVENPRMENGIFPEASRRTTVLCPREDEGLFHVEARGSLLSNFIIRNCSLNYRGEEPYGIISIAGCSTSQRLGTVSLHHLEFEANFLKRSPALQVQEPSCSGIQIIDVRFQDNSCIGTCVASLPTRAEIQNITLTANRFFEENKGLPTLIRSHSGSRTTIDGLIASGNNGTAVHVANGDLRMSNSHVFQNSGGLTQTRYFTAGVTLLSSSGQIEDCRFEGNEGSVGSSIAIDNSSSVIRRTSVVGCNSTRMGGGISITLSSTVRILDCTIAHNSAGLTGGGVYSNGTINLQIQNTTFENNSAQTGGGLYFAYEDLDITNSTFQKNSANGDGAGLYSLRSSISVRDSTFTSSIASISGGGGYIQHSSYNLTNVTLVQNEAPNGGGLALCDSFGSLNYSYFERNSAPLFGGGVYMIRSNMTVLHDCTFVNNSASHGGGVYGDELMLASLLSCRFVRNRVTDSGGGAYFEDGNCTLKGNSFEENYANQYGGGFRGDRLSLNASDTTFIKNNATEGGGGSFFYWNSSAQFAKCTWVANVAFDHGGGTYFGHGSNAAIIDSSFRLNQAELGGGAYVTTADIRLVNVSGNHNAVKDTGGVFFLLKSTATMSNCSFAINRATDAGAIFVSESEASISTSRFESNEASIHGGAIGCVESRNLTIEDCYFASNRAGAYGGSMLIFESVSRATNLQFQNNSAASGGALGSYDSSIVVSTSSFVSNVAVQDGGAIDSEGNGVLLLEGCRFAFNSAIRYGGAIVASGSPFSGNSFLLQNSSALVFRGVGYTQQNTSDLLSNSEFFREFSGYWGGALSVTETALIMRNISIADCSAVSGGGIHLYRSLANINETSVTRCQAVESGGGIRVIESNVTSRVLNVSLNTAVGTSRHRPEGGGIAMEGSSRLLVRNATFDGNRAGNGAGIRARDECVVLVSDGYFYNNSATMFGGAAVFHSSFVTMKRIVCERNNAFYGGSFHVFNSSLTLNDCQLINSSSADAGGSLLAQETASVVVEGTTIQSSRAANGGGIMLTGSNLRGYRVQFRNCSARIHGGGVGLNESSSILCTECLFEGNSASQEGGALRLESLEPQNLAVQLANTVFQNNDAAFGGAVHFQTGNGSANCSDVNSTECTFLALTGCVFTNNSARSVGGAILANNPQAVRISCDPLNKVDPFASLSPEEVTALSGVLSEALPCTNWLENTAAAYGPIVGSYARRVSTTIELGPNRWKEIPGSQYVLRNHSSGDPLPTISLEALDEFSRGPAFIQNNQQIEAVMTSPDRLFAGIFIVRMEDSRGNFSGITVYQEPGNYDIHINFSERAMPTLSIVVEIRECLIGELKTANGTLCQLCGDTTFNFEPSKNKECITCPDDAKCDSVAIRPEKGFWHQTPCSTYVQHCLSERACDEHERDNRLLALGSRIKNCDSDDEFMSNYSQALCREGYTGPLCGSCKASHGKTRSFRCEECYGRFISLVLVVTAGLVLLGLTAFAIKSGLPTNRHKAGENQSSRKECSASHRINMQMVQMASSEAVHEEMIYPHQWRQETNTNTNAPAAQQQTQGSAELAKRKAVEIFKITINYLQVIAVAIAVNVAWTGALIGLFEIAEFIGGVTSEATGRSADCMISADSSTPRSVVRTIVNLLLPAIVGALCVLFWTVAKIRNKQGYSCFMKRCLLSVLVVSYLSYIAVTKTAVNVFYGVEVYDSVKLGDSSTTKYWAVDTALKCYDGSHNVLAFVFGLPVLVLFSLGFPVLVAFVLVVRKRQEGIQSPWLFETAGFLFRSYDEKFIYWESVILLRKAALAVIVVFAYPLGGNLQGLLAVCVLLIALYFHTLCSPYRSEFETLNRLEGFSLLISSLTFVSGLFLNDDRTSLRARVAITLFVVLTDIGVFIYFLVRFFVAGATYLGIVLESEGVVFDQDATSFGIVKTFMKNRFDRNVRSAVRRFNTITSRHDEESRTSEVETELAVLR